MCSEGLLTASQVLDASGAEREISALPASAALPALPASAALPAPVVPVACVDTILPRTLQELSPAGARLCLDVRRFLSAQIKKDNTGNAEQDTMSGEMIVGFSGGADSTALALVLHCLGMPLCLAHLDHSLRPESAAEAHAATGFAERLGVPCQSRRIDVAELARSQGMGLEEAGRQARYAFLEEVRQTRNAHWIATGHHLDDLGEDVLLRLTRGTGWPQLGGMEAMDSSRHLVRPLLTVRRERLVAFLCERNITWVEDASNQSEAFRRNRLRKNVIPLLQAENPAFSQSVRTLWELAREDATYWNDLLAPVFALAKWLREEKEGKTEETLFLPRTAFSRLPRAARLRVYMGLIRRYGGGQAQAETLFRLDQSCTASRSRKCFQLPGGISMQSDGNGLTLRRNACCAVGTTSA